MTEFLTIIPYWNHLTEDEQRRDQKESYVRHYEPGDQLYGSCVDCVGMIYVLHGEIRAYLLSDEGREVTLFRVRERDCCVLNPKPADGQAFWNNECRYAGGRTDLC